MSQWGLGHINEQNQWLKPWILFPGQALKIQAFKKYNSAFNIEKSEQNTVNEHWFILSEW